MTQFDAIVAGGPLFDGRSLQDGHGARFEASELVAIGPVDKLGRDLPFLDLAGDILSPGYVDVQVNGGDGVMFNDDPSVETLRRIAQAHRRLGTTMLLPTLITDTLDMTRKAISAATEAIRSGVPGIAGLHLEGPHLSISRKGAHDPELIRAMTDEDLQTLLAASEVLPVLKVTVAPENVTMSQVEALSGAGVIVSIGHSDASFATCRSYADAGARCVTHLFNAMSQLGNREPGVVGAALSDGRLSAGLIADGIHVHPDTIRAAWAAKQGPGGIFLVSDAMAPAGTELDSFLLNDRPIVRRDGRLTLQDGTLAGADLDMTTALRVMSGDVGVPLSDAIAAAIAVPLALLGQATGPEALIGRNVSEFNRICSGLQTVSPLSASLKQTAVHA